MPYVYLRLKMRRTKEEALITKKQIIDDAVVLFLQKGFSSTTLDEIAEKSNLTRGAIYWHYKDKLDIVNELIEEEHKRFTNLLSDLFEKEISPFTKTQNIIEEIVEHFINNKSFRDFIELTWFKIEYTQLLSLKSTKAELT